MYKNLINNDYDINAYSKKDLITKIVKGKIFLKI